MPGEGGLTSQAMLAERGSGLAKFNPWLTACGSAELPHWVLSSRGGSEVNGAGLEIVLLLLWGGSSLSCSQAVQPAGLQPSSRKRGSLPSVPQPQTDTRAFRMEILHPWVCLLDLFFSHPLLSSLWNFFFLGSRVALSQVT